MTEIEPLRVWYDPTPIAAYRLATHRTAEEMTETEPLRLWTIYDHPSDFPDRFIARLSLVSRAGIVATRQTISATSLEELRSKLPPGLYRINRDPGDDPVIVEVWL